ncbi:glycosyltransferase [Kineosporia sp. J2-2]|uniref:Glycosyltransferase n=1 Tax=Kineosporia corallincola TaxID=2835133 RepID=A0ABS5TNA1_9ACTN|nr:glycosyltransferase [Kineosporia corallincola]MBT0772572.1 glycosyltransferase [Kineosporia corallincola]
MPDISVVVPTCQEGDNVAELVDRISRTLPCEKSEIVFVDDSDDHTPQVIAALARSSAMPIRLIHRAGEQRSGGLAGAVSRGIASSSGDFVVVMDADLQHPPELAAQLVQVGRDDPADVVVASRYVGDGDAGGLSSVARLVTSRGSGYLSRVMFPRRVGRRCTDPMTGYFCLRRDAVDLNRLRPRGFKILLEILASHDLVVREVPFSFGERRAGESKASLRNGLHFVIQLLALRIGAPGRFAAVGLAGLVLNLALMFLLMQAGSHYLWAAVVATALTILSNFVMQERLVFDGPRRRNLTARAAQTFTYNGLDAVARMPLLVFLVERGMGSLPAQAATVGLSFAARFVFTSKVVYPRQPTAPGPVTPPSDAEKDAYLAAPQHRWLFWAQAVAMLGVAVSMYGLATNTYWTLIFLGPLALMVVEQALALRTSTFTRRVTVGRHRELVRDFRGAPSVDVFLPTAGEPLEVLANTYEHVARLDWPGELRIHVLDDSAREQVRRLAGAHGFEYLARPGSEFKKAGNLQYALERSRGEHITILDADFVPRPDYLRELVPYLDDPWVGIVQSPQFFATDRSMSWLQRCAGATQEMFFRFVQPSRDAVGAAICVGTSAVYRRRALEAIGGFPLIGHSEDVYCGVMMARKGFQLRYVPVLLTRGACPDNLDAFIAQQYRWCEGSMSLLMDRNFHEEPTMSAAQRASYWSGFLYYLATAVNAALAPLAVLVMVIAYPDRVQSGNMLPLAVATLFWLAVFPVVAFGRWRFEVFRVQAVYGFAHLFCIGDLIRGRAAEWVATGAVRTGTSPRAAVGDRVRRLMGPYLLATQAATLIGLGAGAMVYGFAHYWANIVLALLNAYVYLPVGWAAVRGGEGRLLDRLLGLRPSSEPAIGETA